MAIFTRLLTINIVANKVLGFSFNVIILLLEPVSSSAKFTISLGESEKKAISLPEIRAEETIRSIKTNSENNAPLVSKAKLARKQRCKMLEGGSKSNFYVLVIKVSK